MPEFTALKREPDYLFSSRLGLDKLIQIGEIQGGPTMIKVSWGLVSLVHFTQAMALLNNNSMYYAIFQAKWAPQNSVHYNHFCSLSAEV